MTAPTLRPEHVAEVLCSAIPIEFAMEAGLRSIDEDEAEARGFRPVGSGLLFPFHDPRTGIASDRFALLKPDRQVNGTRYLCPVAEPPRLYFPPATSADALTDTSVDVLVIEGVKKSLAVVSQEVVHK